MQRSPPILVATLFAGGAILGGCTHSPSQDRSHRALSTSPAEHALYATRARNALSNSEEIELPGIAGQSVTLFVPQAWRGTLDDLPPDAPLEICYWCVEANLDADMRWGELISISHKGQTLVDRTRCEVHRRSMERRPARIGYGLPNREFARAFAREFPHAPLILGGCVVGPASLQTAPAYVCPDCEAAYKAWRPPTPMPSPGK